ncbi:MAG: hypothetical protein WBM87_10355 [Woeseiaceae bacterium]
MFGKANKARDAFAFSLGGMTAITSFVPAPAIADDRINKIRDERIRQARNSPEQKPREWFNDHRQPAHDCA